MTQQGFDLGGPAPLDPQRRAQYDVDRTPMAIPRQVYEALGAELGSPARILVPAAGSGPWAQAARERWPSSEITAVEIRPEEQAGLARWCDHVELGDIRAVLPRLVGPFDLIADNPPFSMFTLGPCPHTEVTPQGRCAQCGERKSQAEALRAFVQNLRPLLAERGRLSLYWLSDLGQRATSPDARGVWAACRPLYQMRVQPVEHRAHRGVDSRSYSVWTWPRDPVQGPRWSTWDLPALTRQERRAGA